MSSSLGNRLRDLLRRKDRKHGRRDRLLGVLRQIHGLGFRPASVIDVGAAYGEFTLECRRVFDSARYLLVEPLEEYVGALRANLAGLTDVECVQAAAAAADGELTIHVHGDLVGSSLYLEQEDSSVNGSPRTVPTVTLDRLREQHGLGAPCLIKIDVQGAELDVLAGATELLRDTEYILLEVSFFEFFRDGPVFHEVVEYMHAHGFVAYDIFGMQHRPLDGALSQADIAFVRETGRFRQHHYYATPAQRERQTESLRRRHASKRSGAG